MSQRAGDCDRDDDAGSASIWVVSIIVLVLLVASVTAVRTAAVVVRHRAESAADLAALAGAARIGVDDRSCPAAAAVARRNGAHLIGCVTHLDPELRSGTVSARVAITVTLPFAGRSQVVATARAGRLPGTTR